MKLYIKLHKCTKGKDNIGLIGVHYMETHQAWRFDEESRHFTSINGGQGSYAFNRRPAQSLNQITLPLTPTLITSLCFFPLLCMWVSVCMCVPGAVRRPSLLWYSWSWLTSAVWLTLHLVPGTGLTALNIYRVISQQDLASSKSYSSIQTIFGLFISMDLSIFKSYESHSKASWCVNMAGD